MHTPTSLCPEHEHKQRSSHSFSTAPPSTADFLNTYPELTTFLSYHMWGSEYIFTNRKKNNNEVQIFGTLFFYLMSFQSARVVCIVVVWKLNNSREDTKSFLSSLYQGSYLKQNTFFKKNNESSGPSSEQLQQNFYSSCKTDSHTKRMCLGSFFWHETCFAIPQFYPIISSYRKTLDYSSASDVCTL